LAFPFSARSRLIAAHLRGKARNSGEWETGKEEKTRSDCADTIGVRQSYKPAR
jgi:hypothetical protein